MCTALNVHFGTSYTADSFTTYPFKETLTSKEWKWFKGDVKYDPTFLLNLAPYTDAIAAVNRVHQSGVRVTVATDRNDPDTTAPVSQRWLDQYGVRYDRFVSVGDSTKQTLAGQVHLDGPDTLFCDDDPRKCAFVPGPHAELMLPRRPYTPPSVPRDCTIFNTWNDVLDVFDLPPFERTAAKRWKEVQW